jgi:hypothetical protein
MFRYLVKPQKVVLILLFFGRLVGFSALAGWQSTNAKLTHNLRSRVQGLLLAKANKSLRPFVALMLCHAGLPPQPLALQRAALTSFIFCDHNLSARTTGNLMITTYFR